MKIDWFTMIVAFFWSFSMGIAILALISMWNAEQHIVALQETSLLEAQSCNLFPMQEN